MVGQAGEARVAMGRIGAPHGVKGWVRIQSETRPRENLLDYTPWYLGEEQRPCRVLEVRTQGKHLVARIEGIDSREQAAALTHGVIRVDRAVLPPAAEDEYYWADLEGLAVVAEDGTSLGTVDGLMETGANDVLVVRGERERLIPFIQGSVVREVSLAEGRITVDWDPDF